MWPGLENWENQTFSRNQRRRCLGVSKGLMVCEAYMICLRRQRSPPFQRVNISFVWMSLHMASYIEDHENITSCRKNPWEKLQAFPTVVCYTSIKAQWEKKRMRERSRESHLFSCKVLTGCSTQRIRHVNQALEVVSAPGQAKNEKCLNEEGN